MRLRKKYFTHFFTQTYYSFMSKLQINNTSSLYGSIGKIKISQELIHFGSVWEYFTQCK